MNMPIFIKLSKTIDNNTKDEFYVNIYKIIRFSTTNAGGVDSNYVIIENEGLRFIDQIPEEIGATLNKIQGVY